PRWVEQYAKAGREGVDLMAWSLGFTHQRLEDVPRVLLLPCGHGRVVRHLIERVDPDRITACDVDRQAVRRCAAAVGVRRLVSCRDLTRLKLPESYDLIFVGSLLTHLAAEDCFHLMGQLERALRPGGHLVFTTQGETCLGHLDWYGPTFGTAEAWYREE